MLAELYTYQAIFSHFIPAHIMVISRFLGNTKDTIGSLKNFHFKWRLFNALKKIYIYIYIYIYWKPIQIYKIPCNVTIYTSSDSIQVWRFFKLKAHTKVTKFHATSLFIQAHVAFKSGVFSSYIDCVESVRIPSFFWPAFSRILFSSNAGNGPEKLDAF